MSLNRATAPAFGDITSFSLEKAKTYQLSNGVSCHYISAGVEEVLRIDFYFDAGSKFQPQPALATAVNSLLSEGSSQNNSSQLAEKLDYFGAFTHSSCSIEEGSFSVFCLKKHLEPCLRLVWEILTDPVFPQNELEVYKNTQIERLRVDLQKNNYLTRTAFYRNIFGAQSPYGQSPEIENFLSLQRDALIDFHKVAYHKPAYIIASGMVDGDALKIIDAVCGQNTLAETSRNLPAAELFPSHVSEKRIFIEKGDSLQAAIRMGKRLFDRTHPDFKAMQLLNLLFGGFFGSRLMKNIREEKGLTYGIHSSLESYKGAGVFFISTEVNNDLYETAVKEINMELSRLCEDLIPENELSVARNYLLGAFLRSIDGAFAMADRYKILHDYNLGYSYFSEYVEVIKSVKPVELRNLAQKYLQPNEMQLVITGKSIFN